MIDEVEGAKINVKSLTDTLRHRFAAGPDAVAQWAHLAAVVESSADSIVSVTLDSRIQSWNAGATSLFGYEAEEMLGRSLLAIIPKELHAQEFHLLERIRAGERIQHFDTTRRAKSGRLVPISLTVSPVRDGRGVVIGASKIARDISDRKRAERLLDTELEALAKLTELSSSLWRSSSTLNAALEEMLIAVMELVSADKGSIQLLDNEQQRLAIACHKGFDREFLDVFREISPQHRSACGRALRDCARVIIEDVELDADYEPLRPVARTAGYRAVVATPLLGADGTALGVASTYFCTVHRPTVQELHRLDLYLRQASDFIQRYQMEEALRDSQMALLEADHRKDEFLALLAHELRNPLTPIRYAVATVKDPARTAAQVARAAQVIERQAAHMSRLLEDLLDVSRITMGKLELKTQLTDLNAVLRAAIEAARPTLEAKGHKLIVELPVRAMWAIADPVRLAQIFSNLLNNAAKYTDPGGRIRLAGSSDGEKITIRVRDNGIGISPEVLPRLFTPFFQSARVASRAEGGVGVGLSLVRALVTLHAGSIGVFSDGPGQGSEFVVELPCTFPPGKEWQTSAETPKAVSARPLRILLVDDNRDAADSCATLLELAGYQLRIAYSGREALALAESFHPQVAVLDIGLPDLNGYAVAEKIRSTMWGRNTALVAVTGWGRDDDRKRALTAGFDHHLTKPVAGGALQSLLQSLSNSLSE